MRHFWIDLVEIEFEIWKSLGEEALEGATRTSLQIVGGNSEVKETRMATLSILSAHISRASAEIAPTK